MNVQPLSLKNQRLFKMLPRVVAYYIIEKEISQKPETLPHIQDIGIYMQKVQGLNPTQKSLNVVTMKIQISNFYMTNGDDESLRQYDESKELENCAEIADKFLQIVQNVTYSLHGDVIDFFNESIIACFPGQVLKGNECSNILRALHAGLKIFYLVSELLVNSRREVNIGIGYGDCIICHVGGIFNRQIQFTVGDALAQAQASLSLAKFQKGMIVSKILQERIQQLKIDHDIDLGFQDPLIHASKIHINGFVKLDTTQQTLEPQFKEHPFKNEQKSKNQISNQIISFLNQLMSQLKKSRQDIIYQEMSTYIPQYFRPFLNFQVSESKQLWHSGIKQANHHRVISTMNMTMELDGAFESEESLFVLQTAIEIVQKQIYKMNGALSKILYDSNQGGLNIIAEWGLNQPLTGENNAAQACITGINIRQAMREFVLQSNENCHDGTTSMIELPIHIGIATGQLFKSIVGNDSAKSYRLDIATVGEPYNRATILHLIASQDFGKIYVDKQTMFQARSRIDVNYVKHINIASKFFNMPIFEPLLIDHIDEVIQQQSVQKNSFLQYEEDFIKQGSFIRINHNPLIMDFNNSYQLFNNKLYGRAPIVKSLIKSIIKRVRTWSSQSSVESIKPFSILIKGEKGSGKSLISRNILINLKQLENLVGQQVKQLSKNEPLAIETSIYDIKKSNTQLKFRFCVSQCHRDAALQFLGVWRPVMRTMVSHVASVMDKKPKKILSMFIEKFQNLTANKLQFFQDFFGFQDMDYQSIEAIRRSVPQIIPIKFSKFYEPIRYDEDFEEDVLIFLQNIIIESFEIISQKKSSVNLNSVIIFIIDNASLMKEIDWKFYKLLVQVNDIRYKNLMMILNIDQQIRFIEPLKETISNYGLDINNYAQKYYYAQIKPIEKEIYHHLVDLEPLTENCLQQILIDQSQIYFKQINEEILKMVQFMPPEAKIQDSNPTVSKTQIIQLLDNSSLENKISMDNIELLKNQLLWKYQASTIYKNFSSEVLQLIIRISQGNPLKALSFFYQFLITGFFEIQNEKVQFTKRMREQLNYGLFNHNLQIPSNIFNILHTGLYRVTSKIQNSYLENPLIYVACLYTLQVSALLDRQFSTQMLINSQVCPVSFQISQIKQISLNQILDILEEYDFVEMIHEQHQNRFYRFNQEIVQMIISQIMPFGDFKSKIHQAYVSYHSTVNHIDYFSQFNSQYDLKFLQKQLMLGYQIQIYAKLDEKSQAIIFKKEASLKCQENTKNLIFLDQIVKAKGAKIDEYFQVKPDKGKKQIVSEYYDLKVRLVGIEQGKKEYFEIQVMQPEKNYKIYSINIEEIANVQEFDPMQGIDYTKPKKDEPEKFGLIINFKDKISLKFQNKLDVLDWSTKIKYLNERLQYDFFISKFKNHIVQPQLESFDKYDPIIVRKIKKKNNESFLDSSMNVELHRQSGINKSDALRQLMKDREAAAQKQENLFKLKDQLRLMYSLSFNHLASHAGRQVKNIIDRRDLDPFPQTLSYTPEYIQDLIIDSGIQISQEKLSLEEEKEVQETSSLKTETEVELLESPTASAATSEPKNTVTSVIEEPVISEVQEITSSQEQQEYGVEDPYQLRDRFGRLNRYIQNENNLDYIIQNIENSQNLVYEEQLAVVPNLAFEFQTPFFDGEDIARLNLDDQESGFYKLKCQHSKRVFTDQEIQSFKLQRRVQTTEVQFSIKQILGQQFYEEEEDELDLEMQHMLAAAITKILDQKSNMEIGFNFQEQIVNEIEGQMQKESSKLKIQASQKLIESIKNNDKLSRNFSRASGLRSQALLQNFIRNSREEKTEEIRKLSQVLSQASLIQKSQTILTVEQSIEELKTRELISLNKSLNNSETAHMFRSKTSTYEKDMYNGMNYANSKSVQPYVLEKRLSTQRSALFSNQSLPVIEQDQEEEASQASLIESLHSLIEKKESNEKKLGLIISRTIQMKFNLLEQQFFEQTFNKKEFASQVKLDNEAQSNPNQQTSNNEAYTSSQVPLNPNQQTFNKEGYASSSQVPSNQVQLENQVPLEYGNTEYQQYDNQQYQDTNQAYEYQTPYYEQSNYQEYPNYDQNAYQEVAYQYDQQYDQHYDNQYDPVEPPSETNPVLATNPPAASDPKASDDFDRHSRHTSDISKRDNLIIKDDQSSHSSTLSKHQQRKLKKQEELKKELSDIHDLSSNAGSTKSKMQARKLAKLNK